MIIIHCPYCKQDRHEEELTYGGEADLVRPIDPSTVSDEVWCDYLYMRINPKGQNYEQWCCSSGCGQWFKVERDTVTHAVTEVMTLDQFLPSQQK